MILSNESEHILRRFRFDLGSTQCYQVVMNERGKIIRSRSFATNEQNLRSAFQTLEGELRVHTEAGELKI